MLWHLVFIFFIFLMPHGLNGEIGAVMPTDKLKPAYKTSYRISNCMPMKKLLRNLILIKEDCGDVCDTSDNFIKAPGIHFDRIEKNIQCEYLFESPVIEDNTDVSEQQLDNDPPVLANLPKDVQQQYTFEGRIPIFHTYMNDIRYLRDSEKKAKMEIIRDNAWERKSIEIGQEQYRNDMLAGAYGSGVVVNMTKLIKEYMIEQVCIM